MKKTIIAIIIGLGLITIPVIASNKYHIVTVGGECEDNCIENGYFAYADTSNGYRYFIELENGEGSAITNSKYIVKNIDGSKREVKTILKLK